MNKSFEFDLENQVLDSQSYYKGKQGFLNPFMNIFHEEFEDLHIE